MKVPGAGRHRQRVYLCPMGRPTPFDLVFADYAADRFPEIRNALAAAGADPRDRDAFLVTLPVMTLLRELRPDEEERRRGRPGTHRPAPSRLSPLGGRPSRPGRSPAAEARALLASPTAERAASRRDAAYVQLPERLVWASLSAGGSVGTARRLLRPSGPDGTLRVLGIFGLHPSRMGFTVAEAAGAPGPVAGRTDGSPLFSPALEGGALAGIQALVDPGELVELAGRMLEGVSRARRGWRCRDRPDGQTGRRRRDGADRVVHGAEGREPLPRPHLSHGGPGGRRAAGHAPAGARRRLPRRHQGRRPRHARSRQGTRRPPAGADSSRTCATRCPPDWSRCWRSPDSAWPRSARSTTPSASTPSPNSRPPPRTAGSPGCPRFGQKTADNIRKSIAFLRQASAFRLAHHAAEESRALVEALARVPGVLSATAAGDVRRRSEVVSELVIVLVAEVPAADLFTRLGQVPGVHEFAGRDERQVTLRFAGGTSAQVIATPPGNAGAVLVQATGSEAHLRDLEARAAATGYSFRGTALWRGSEFVATPDEAALYRALGLAWIPPELREGRGECDAAAGGTLPIAARTRRPARIPPLPHRVLRRLQHRGGPVARRPRRRLRLGRASPITASRRPTPAGCRRPRSSVSGKRSSACARRCRASTSCTAWRPTSSSTGASTTRTRCSRGSISSSAPSTAGST